MKRHLSGGAGVLVSLTFVYLVTRNVEWRGVRSALVSADYLLLVPAVALFLLSNVLRSLLWRVLLAPSNPLPWGRLFRHLMIGLLANNLLPGRMGELVRAHGVGREGGQPRTQVLSSIVFERLLDVVWLLGCCSVALWFPLPAHWPLRLAQTTGAILIAIGVVIAASIRWGHVLRRWVCSPFPVRIRARLLAESEYYMDALLSGLSVLRRPRDLVISLILSWACWGTWTGFLAMTLGAYGIHPPLPALLILTGVINLSVMIPAAPGYVGTFQFGVVNGLLLFGVARETGLGVSLVLHAMWYVPTTVLGAYFLWRMGFRFRALRLESAETQ